MVNHLILRRISALSGLSGVFILWVAVILGMTRSGLGLIDSRPLSYIGIATDSARLFNGALFVSALLFLVFGLRLYRQYRVGKYFLVFFIVGQVAQLVASVFVYDGPDKLIHTVSAFTLATAIPIYMRQFARSVGTESGLKLAANILYRVELAAFVVGIGAFVFIKGISPLAEILPAVPFHIWVILLSCRMIQQK